MENQDPDNPPIDSYRLGNRDVFYVPNFLSEEEEQYILRKICDSPRQKWKQLRNRRLQILGGEITAKGLLPQTLPSYLTLYPAIIGRLKETGAFVRSPHQQPNHVILNEYKPGQGIMPHEDGPKYYPVVATISLGSHAVFNFYQYKGANARMEDTEGKAVDSVPVFSILLEPRSLVISSGNMYTSYLHGIDPLEEDVVLSPFPTESTSSHNVKSDRYRISQGISRIENWGLLGDQNTKQVLMDGGVLKRGTRYSLTCRDVKCIASAKSFRVV